MMPVTQSLPVESSPSTVNTVASEQSEDDHLDKTLKIDTSRSVSHHCSQRSEHDSGSSSSSPKTSTSPALKHSSGGVRTEERAPSQRSDSEVQESVQMARDATSSVNVSHASRVCPISSPAVKVKGAWVDSDVVDAPPASSCAQQTPPADTGGSLASVSQSVFSTTSSGDSASVTENELNTRMSLKCGQCSTVPSQLLSQDVIGEGGEAGEEKEKEEMVKKGENTLGHEGLAGQVLSPEPMEMVGREEEGSSLVLGFESEINPVPLEKDDALPSSTQQQRKGSQSALSKVSTNDHGSQSQPKDACDTPDNLSQADGEGPEAKGGEDKSLSDSSGDHHRETSTASGEMVSKTYSTLSKEQRGMDHGRGLLDAWRQPVVKLYRINRHRETSTVSGETASKTYSTLSEEQWEMDQGHGLLDARRLPVVKLYRMDPLRHALCKELSLEQQARNPRRKKERKTREEVKTQADKETSRPTRDKQLCKGKTSFSCTVCGKGFSTKQCLKVHLMIHTGEKPFACKDCGKGFRQIGHLQSHMRTHTETKSFSCTECGKMFKRKEPLKVHMMYHTGERPFSCTVCSKDFCQKEVLKIHMRTHTGVKPFPCTVCKNSFVQRAHLNSHMKTHRGEKPYSCTICGKGARHKSELKMHMRTHTGEKPFVCIVCGKGFKESGKLKTHMRTHTGEKPFRCTVCGKRFSQIANRITHMRTHTGEKPFTCTVCGKGCSQMGALTLHMKIHTGEKPFTCTVCGKGCREMGHLRTHMRTHTGEKPFTCTVCGTDFGQSSHLKRHLTTHAKPKEASRQTSKRKKKHPQCTLVSRAPKRLALLNGKKCNVSTL